MLRLIPMALFDKFQIFQCKKIQRKENLFDYVASFFLLLQWIFWNVIKSSYMRTCHSSTIPGMLFTLPPSYSPLYFMPLDTRFYSQSILTPRMAGKDNTHNEHGQVGYSHPNPSIGTSYKHSNNLPGLQIRPVSILQCREVWHRGGRSGSTCNTVMV